MKTSEIKFCAGLTILPRVMVFDDYDLVMYGGRAAAKQTVTVQ